MKSREAKGVGRIENNYFELCQTLVLLQCFNNTVLLRSLVFGCNELSESGMTEFLAIDAGIAFCNQGRNFKT